jgi:signal transduction histidine kinase
MTPAAPRHMVNAIQPADGEPDRSMAGRSWLEEQLDERVRFEALLADLSAAFVSIQTYEVDAQIEQGLRRVAEFLDLDRSTFGEMSEDRKQILTTHSYVAPGIPPFPRVVLDTQFPWLANRLRQGELVRYVRLPDDLPNEAAAERAHCAQSGLKSNVTIPFQVGGTMQCIIGFGSFRHYRAWPDALVRRLRLLGDVFANAVARKRAEGNTQRLRDQLARAARITTMGELAAAIAHEINQPLCAIVSNAQAGLRLLAADAADIEEVSETLQDIAADGRRAAEVIVRIRTMLEGHAPKRALLNLNEVIAEVAALLHHQLRRKGVFFSLALAEGLPPVDGDRVQLQQVALNLIVNAIDALGHSEGPSRQIVVESATFAPGSVRVSVRDSGPGIQSEDADRIFEAFFSTKAGGLGIGLAVSSSIVTAHGGRIWAESNAGGGAAFHFTIPAALEPRP